MGCKRAKNKKDKEQIKNISKSDEFQLSLLNLQVKIILIYMISNIFLFGGTLQSINISCNKKASDSNPNILLIEGQYLALIASILISYVDFSRYNELNERYKKESASAEQTGKRKADRGSDDPPLLPEKT